MEYKASKKANDTDHAIPLCDRRIPLLDRHGLFTLMKSGNTRDKKITFTHLLYPGQLEKFTALQFLLSQSVPLMVHFPGHILNPAIATPTRSGWIVPGLSRNSPGTSAWCVNCAKIELVGIDCRLTSYWPQSRLTSSSILTSVCADSLLVATVTAIWCLSAKSSVRTSTS